MSALLAAVVVGASACGGPSVPPPATGRSPTPRALAPAMALVGPMQTVFDWTTDACDREDIPDLPARAFRDADGQVQVIASHYFGRRFVGPNLNEVTRDCRLIMLPPLSADPSQYSDRTWLAAPYTEDGRTVHALIHHEYQGHQHPGQCPQGEYFPCWYNSVTLAVSTDAGESYRPAAAPPEHVVAALPQRYEAGAGPYGVFEPSNIIKGRDGRYYAYVRVDEYRSDQQRICLMRTTSLGDAASWRAWDGTDFTVQLSNPYLRPDGTEPARPCVGIDPERLGVMGSSVTFNTYLDRYVMVGVTAIQQSGREVWGVQYAFSDDLIGWQQRRLLVEVELPWTYQPGDANVYLHPALLDPVSPSRNFETTGQTAFLYLTRFNTREAGNSLGTLDRDLVRIPVEFFPSADEARAAAVPFSP